MQNPDLDEASGLEASNLNPGVLYGHNDHGGKNEVFAFGTDGEDIGIRIEEKLTNVSCQASKFFL